MKGTDGKQFHCSYPGCDKVFNRRDYLERHATNHLSVKPFVCVQCNRHFSRKDLYDNHLTTKRHARVLHEVEQTSHDELERTREANNWGPISNSAASQLDFANKAQLEDTFGSQGLPESNRHPVYDEYDTGISEYAPPIMQPLYLSGPGPGDAGMNVQNRNNRASAKMTRESADAKTSKLFAGTDDRFLSEQSEAQMKTSGMPTVPEDLDMDMPWESPSIGANTMSHMETVSNKDDAEGNSSSYGQFSTYGVPLNLEYANSSSGRSDGSSTDDASDPDNRNSVFAVSERIRKDMAINPVPSPGLRENDAQYPQHRAYGPTGQDVDADQEPHMAGSLLPPEEMLVLKESAPSQPNSLSEVVASASGDERYAWFFDDTFDTEMAKLGYDRCYSESVESYEERSRAFSKNAPSYRRNPAQHNAFSHSSSRKHDLRLALGGDFRMGDAASILSDYPSTCQPLHQERALEVLSVLNRTPSGQSNLEKVDMWIQSAWVGADAVRQILHPAAYNPNNTHLSLLSVLALIGISLSDDRRLTSRASKSYTSVFFYAYNAVAQLPSGIAPNKLDLYTVNKLQAFCLLLRYERLILFGDRTKFRFTRSAQGRYITDMFLGKVLATIPHLGQFSAQTKQQPIWATLSTEGYLFHQGADFETQWREWVLIESAKRTAHFALYCDSIMTHFTAKPNPVSIFNIDIHMVCPDALWRAKTAEEFFYVSGPTGRITNVPYLNLIKSLIRFPRAGQNGDVMMHALPQINAPWSMGALKFVAHGLIKIVTKLSGLIPHGDEVLQALMQSRLEPNHRGDIFSKFDRQVQARLYRGLDVWYHYFSATYGDVTDQILRVPGSINMAIRDDSDTPLNKEGDNGIPQYALIIVLCHYSSFIFMHEDLPIVLQVTANVRSWLDTHESKSLQMLLDYLYMPLYTNWFKTDEAKGLVSASTLYLAWMHAVTGNNTSGNHMFLSAMIYISAIVVWLYDFAANYDQYDAKSLATYSRLELKDFRFMDDAAEYIHAVYKHVCGQGPPPERRSISSVLLLSACLLNKRKSTKPLVDMLIQFVSVMDADLQPEDLLAVVKQSSHVYDQRATEAQLTAAGPAAADSSSENSSDSSPRTSDPYADVDEIFKSDAHLSQGAFATVPSNGVALN